MVIAHGELADRRFVAHYRAEGRVVGVLGWNMARQLRQDRLLTTKKGEL